MTSGVLIIFLKDLRESLRNRRAVIRMFLLTGLVVPFTGHLLLSFADKSREDLSKVVLDYAIAGEQNLPELVKGYEAEKGLHRVSVPDGQVENAVRDKQIRFALRIPTDAAQTLKSGKGVNVEFIYHQGDPSAVAIKDRGTAALQAFSERQRNWRLMFLGVARENDRAILLDPVSYVVVNTATDRERIGFGLGGIVAYAFLAVCLMGCTFAALDLVAGEKEKGTLEILVMAPVPRRQIVLGKYLVIFVFGLVYATLSAISLSAWLVYETSHGSDIVRNVITQITPREVFLLWTTLVPVTALFAAHVLAVSTYSRSYREATSLISVANVLEALLVMVAFVPGISLRGTWSLVPVSNLSLMIRELIRGTLDNYTVVLSIFSSTLAVGLVLLLFSTAWFRREAIIYRD